MVGVRPGCDQEVAPPVVIEKCMGVALLIYCGTGVLTMALAGKFLIYNVARNNECCLSGIVPSVNTWGIFLVEIAVAASLGRR